METYRILSYEEAREAKIYELYSCLVGPDGFECTLTEPEDRTWGRDLLPVVERLNEYAARIRELEAQLTAAQERNTKLQSEHLDHVYALHEQLTAANAEIERGLWDAINNPPEQEDTDENSSH